MRGRVHRFAPPAKHLVWQRQCYRGLVRVLGRGRSREDVFGRFSIVWWLVPSFVLPPRSALCRPRGDAWGLPLEKGTAPFRGRSAFLQGWRLSHEPPPLSDSRPRRRHHVWPLSSGPQIPPSRPLGRRSYGLLHVRHFPLSTRLRIRGDAWPIFGSSPHRGRPRSHESGRASFAGGGILASGELSFEMPLKERKRVDYPRRIDFNIHRRFFARLRRTL